MTLRNLETPAEREVRRLIELAYTRGLEKHLSSLEGEFARWRAGGIDAATLAEKVRTFNDGPASFLARQYKGQKTMTALGHAVVAGLVRDAEVPAEIKDELAVVINVLKFKK